MELDLDLDFDLNLETDKFKPDNLPNQKAINLKLNKNELIKINKKDKLKEIIKKIPDKDSSIHYISSGTFDFYTIIPAILDILNKQIEEIYISTWTMNRDTALCLLDNFDKKKYKKISILTGLYFKRRETAVYSTLLTGLKKRKQRYIACKNHTKIILFKIDNNYIVIEGSANLTSNPRIEQYHMTNSEKLFYFHRQWMEELFNG